MIHNFCDMIEAIVNPANTLEQAREWLAEEVNPQFSQAPWLDNFREQLQNLKSGESYGFPLDYLDVNLGNHTHGWFMRTDSGWLFHLVVYGRVVLFQSSAMRHPCQRDFSNRRGSESVRPKKLCESLGIHSRKMPEAEFNKAFARELYKINEEPAKAE